MIDINEDFLNFLIEDISVFTNNFDNEMYIFDEDTKQEICIFTESYNSIFRFQIKELQDSNLECKFQNKNFIGFESIYTNIFKILLENEDNKIKKEIEMIEESLENYNNEIEMITLLLSKLPIDIALKIIK